MDDLEQRLLMGMTGVPETLPAERALFLSTIRERIYLALTKIQVVQRGMYKEAQQLLQNKKNIHLYINGDLTYSSYANYIKEAIKYNVPFTVVTDGVDTPIGLVIACHAAIHDRNDDHFFIKDEYFERNMK